MIKIRNLLYINLIIVLACCKSKYSYTEEKSVINNLNLAESQTSIPYEFSAYSDKDAFLQGCKIFKSHLVQINPIFNPVVFHVRDNMGRDVFFEGNLLSDKECSDAHMECLDLNRKLQKSKL